MQEALIKIETNTSLMHSALFGNIKHGATLIDLNIYMNKTLGINNAI